MPAYDRVIVKVSGEALSAGDGNPLSRNAVERLAGEIKSAAAAGAEIGVVVGGGNILRGITAGGSAGRRVTADYIGMLSTIVNGLALRDALEAAGSEATLMSAIPCGAIAELHDPRRADRLLADKQIVIFAAGIGNPFLSTDTSAALRAAELGARALLKATKVDGVYESDPLEDPQAARFDRLSYGDYLERRLGVMDLTAVSVCREHGIPIVVFDLSVPGNIARAVGGDAVGTTVKEE